MQKLLKIFPFMPAEKETKKFIFALLFHLLAVPAAAGIVGAILLPLAPVIGLVGGVYNLAGLILVFMSFFGCDVEKLFEKKEETPAEEPKTEE